MASRYTLVSRPLSFVLCPLSFVLRPSSFIFDILIDDDGRRTKDDSRFTNITVMYFYGICGFCAH